jgi:hypothetical protein
VEFAFDLQIRALNNAGKPANQWDVQSASNQDQDISEQNMPLFRHSSEVSKHFRPNCPGYSTVNPTFGLLLGSYHGLSLSIAASPWDLPIVTIRKERKPTFNFFFSCITCHCRILYIDRELRTSYPNK